MLGNYPAGTKVAFIGKKGRTIPFGGKEKASPTSVAAAPAAKSEAPACPSCAAKAEAAKESD